MLRQNRENEVQALDGLVQPDRVHRGLYTDAAIFDAEIRLIFERTWVFVGHESEVAEPGDYKTGYLGRQPIIMARSDDGGIHVLMNRCMHRGAVVCREEKGNSRAFRCVYHGWTYSNRGELIGVTYRDGFGRGFDPSTLALRRAPRVAAYRGFVFASLSPTGISLEDYLGRATAYIDTIVDAAPDGDICVRSGVQKYLYPGNWKFQIENWMDGYHPNFTHQTAFEIRERRTGHKPGSTPGTGATARTFGYGHAVLDYTSTRPGKWAALARKNPDYMHALEAKRGVDGAKDVLYRDPQLLVFPNLFFQKDRQHFRVVRPVAVDKTEIYAYPYTLKGAPDALNRYMVADLAWWASAAGFGQPDDVEAFVRCQEGLQVTDAEWLLFLRGIDNEEIDSHGEIVGDITDETPQRGIYREWKRLMVTDANGSTRG